jgi:RNA polymerase sigma-70 factor, ECF subfamily
MWTRWVVARQVYLESQRNQICNLTPAPNGCLLVRMEETEAAAIQRILDGDPDEYRVLMDRHFHSVFRMAFRVTGNESDAEEAAQEAFLRAYNKLSTFKQDSSFLTWMRRIAINTSISLVERRNRDLGHNAPRVADEGSAREGTVQVLDRAAGPEQLVFAAEALTLRERAMAALTPMERTAFTLRHMEDLPLAEIATALNIPTNSVKQAVFRAVSKLRQSLAPLAGGMR